VLASTSFTVDRGETLAVIGPSGAGKSTLAEVLLGLRRPASGTVSVAGVAWHRPTRGQRHLVQGVPQDATAAFVPRWTLGRSIADAVRRLTGDDDVPGRIARAAELADLDPALLAYRPAEVSGGQAQRAAIVRALAVGPAVLVADEPTSALDPERTRRVSTALVGIARTTATALVLITHDPAVAALGDRTRELLAPTHDAHGREARTRELHAPTDDGHSHEARTRELLTPAHDGHSHEARTRELHAPSHSAHGHEARTRELLAPTDDGHGREAGMQTQPARAR